MVKKTKILASIALLVMLTGIVVACGTDMNKSKSNDSHVESQKKDGDAGTTTDQDRTANDATDKHAADGNNNTTDGGVVEDAVDGAADVGGAVVDGAADVGGAVVDGAKDVGDAVVDGVKDVGDGAEDAVDDATDNADQSN